MLLNYFASSSQTDTQVATRISMQFPQHVSRTVLPAKPSNIYK